MKMKKIIKFFILFFMLGICTIYTYRFISDNYNSDNKREDLDNMEGEVGSQPSSPSVSSIPHQNFKAGWERIKYAYLPDLPQLIWTDVGVGYVVGVENMSYKVVDASIQKKFNPKWNFKVLDEFGMYSFREDRSLDGKKSYVSARISLKNLGKSVCNCCLKNISLHIYDKEGNKIISKEPDTTSQNKTYSKGFFFEKISSGEKYEVEVVYVVEDKHLDSNYYYFIDVNPYAIYPDSQDQVGIFKLPLGSESESYDKE